MVFKQIERVEETGIELEKMNEELKLKVFDEPRTKTKLAWQEWRTGECKGIVKEERSSGWLTDGECDAKELAWQERMRVLKEPETKAKKLDWQEWRTGEGKGSGREGNVYDGANGGYEEGSYVNAYDGTDGEFEDGDEVRMRQG